MAVRFLYGLMLNSVILLTILVQAGPLTGFAIASPFHGMDIAVIFFFLHVAPQSLPFITLIIAAIIKDTVLGLPMGTHVLIYGIIYGIVTLKTAKTLPKTLTSLWGYYPLPTLIYVTISALIITRTTNSSIPFSDCALTLFFMIIYYPFIHLLCHYLQRLTLHRNRYAR